MRSSVLFVLCLLGASAQAQTPTPETTLGKLFLTPERRQSLERQRQLNLYEAENTESETLQLNGIVQRSSGYNSIWLNQRMQSGHEKQSGIHLKPGRPSAATIEMEKAAPVELQVGDSLNRSTQERKDLVPQDSARAGKHR
jgi:hypothetical protein